MRWHPLSFATALVPQPTKRDRVCEQGHRFAKSSSCPTCPICERQRKPQVGLLATISAPARRALESKGIATVEQLAAFSEKEILDLHGMGPGTIPRLRQALDDAGLTFRT